MLIATQKQDDFYGLGFESVRQNFDSVFKQIKPTLDSIELTSNFVDINWGSLP